MCNSSGHGARHQVTESECSMSDLDPLRMEIQAARDQARAELDRALAALSRGGEPIDDAGDEARQVLLGDVAAKLDDLLVQEELLAALENAAMSMIYDVEPSLQRLARKRGRLSDGGSTPRA
jgi:flagellar motility protein MotE (MotC chaperone)